MNSNADRNLVQVKGVYYFRYTINKKVKKFSLKTKDKRTARKLRDKYLLEIATEGVVERPNKKEEMVVGDLITEYIQELSDRLHAGEIKKSTHHAYLTLLRAYIKPHFATTGIKELTGRDIDKMLRGIEVGKQTKANIRRCISSMYTFAIDEGLLEDNPVAKSKSIVVDDRRKPQAFTLEECYNLCRTYKGWYQEYFEFLLFTGVRTCEASALEWSSVDLVAKTAHIKQSYVRGVIGKPKTKSSDRVIFLPNNVVDALRRQRAKTMGKSSFVFMSPMGKMVCNNNVRKRDWKKALGQCGYEYRELYITRHSFITNAIKNNVPLDIIIKQTGHTDITMIARHYMSDIVVPADADKLQSAFAVPKVSKVLKGVVNN